MRLFPEVDAPSRYIYLKERRAPDVSPDIFWSWPPHMQTEFVLLAREAGWNDEKIMRRAGISFERLAKIRGSRHAHVLTYDNVTSTEPVIQPRRRVVRARS